MQRERKKRKRHLISEKKKRDTQLKDKIEMSLRLEGVRSKSQRYKCLAQKYLKLWKNSATNNRFKVVSLQVLHELTI